MTIGGLAGKKKKCIQTDTGSQKTEKEENSKQGQMSFVSQ